jgi:putative multiple sugar transport system ATP-binding protein
VSETSRSMVGGSPMLDKPMTLEMNNVSKRFAGVVALAGVSLNVRGGEIHAICGENGAGKSTLMSILSGVIAHGNYSGEILLDGELREFKSIRASEAAGVIIIHQELALVPELSIMENLFLGNERSKRGVIDWDSAYGAAVELLAGVGLHDDPTTLVKHIGVGKQQLLEIAKALNKSVKLLILDEPTAALNESDSQHLLDLMLGLKARGITQILISHKLSEIESVADSVTILRDGNSIETLDVRGGGIDENRIIKGMVGRALDSRFPDYESPIGEPVITVEGWNIQDPFSADRLSTKDANFFVRRGEIVGFAGLMGAGRTELAMSIFGRSFGSFISGHMTMNGVEIAPKTVAQAIKCGIGYLPEDRKALGLNLISTVMATTVSAKLKKISRGLVVSEALEYQTAEQYRRDLNIRVPSVREGVSKLSGGGQQKVVLAKWMFTDSEVLILDEPTRGIDVGAKYEIYKIIRALARQGKAIILISSELPELLGLSDRIYTIFEGAITGETEKTDFSPELLMKLMTSARKAS